MTGATRIYLCSQSPRRRELLEQVGIEYTLIDAAIDETPLPQEDPAAYVERLALAKAAAGAARVAEDARLARWPVLGADTSVVVDGVILGKPADHDDARRMLRLLSGAPHEVMTAIALDDGSRRRSTVSRSKVWFRALSDDEIDKYWESGEPVDKAGAYAIQGLGARFVTRIDGSYSGIVGLALFELDELLAHWA